MTDLLLALCEEWEKRANASDAASVTADLRPDMSDIYMVEAATTRRLARELRRQMS